jgi:hypothetical protein
MTSAPPRVAVAMRHNGKPIAAAAPGSTIELEVKVRQTHPGPLHYRWTSDGPGLVSADAPAVTMKLPATAVAAMVFVEITNGKGGILDLSIAVPVKIAASHKPSQFLGILGENGTLLSIVGDNGNMLTILNDNAGL